MGCEGALAFALLDAARLLGPGTSEGREAAVEVRPILERLGSRALLGILDGLEASEGAALETAAR